MQRLEVSGAVRSIYGSLGVRRLTEDVHVNFSRHEIPIIFKKVSSNFAKARHISITKNKDLGKLNGFIVRVI